MKIHPTAIVDPDAQIAGDVEIGPWSIIGGQASVGAGTIIQSHVVLEGSVVIGSRNMIGHGTIIGAPPQDLAFDPATKSGVTIGNNNVIREYCSIHRGTAPETATRVGDNNFLMVGAHLGHNAETGDNVIIANNCLLGGYVRVDDAAFLGGGCVFHQYIRVGRLAITQGASAFSKDVPPFVIAAERNLVFGLNVVGLRRAGYSSKDRDEIKTAFRLIYTTGLNLTQASEKAASMNMGGPAREFLEFVMSAKKRGICPYKRGEQDGDAEAE